MKYVSVLLPLFMVWAAASPALAQETHAFSLEYEVFVCQEVEPGYKYKNCVADHVEDADRELNRVYRAALVALEVGEYGWPERREYRIRYLREAQRAWIAYRDTDCNLAAGELSYGGQYQGAYIAACMAEKTRLRTAELRARYGVE